MTQEDKKLLLKDICARLPYNAKVEITNPSTGIKIKKLDAIVLGVVNGIANGYETDTVIKPYLFPLLSMTEEMLEEFNSNGLFKYRDTIANVSHLESKNGISEEIYTYIDIESISFLIEYFHSHHIDYRGLIEKGLAIDATNKNIY